MNLNGKLWHPPMTWGSILAVFALKATPMMRILDPGWFAMRFHRFFALFVLLFLFCLGGLSGAVRAGSDALYTVRSIPIDITAESASQAKKQALTFGKGQAFSRLIERPRCARSAYAPARVGARTDLVVDSGFFPA